jgi:hypothetical protein
MKNSNTCTTQHITRSQDRAASPSAGSRRRRGVDGERGRRARHVSTTSVDPAQPASPGGQRSYIGPHRRVSAHGPRTRHSRLIRRGSASILRATRHDAFSWLFRRPRRAATPVRSLQRSAIDDGARSI